MLQECKVGKLPWGNTKQIDDQSREREREKWEMECYSLRRVRETENLTEILYEGEERSKGCSCFPPTFPRPLMLLQLSKPTVDLRLVRWQLLVW